MKTTEITFTRMDNARIDCLAVVKFTHQDRINTADELLAAFKKGVTKWVETTKEGKEAWEYSSEDLNIGDLFGYELDEDLGRLLEAEGIQTWECVYQLCEGEEFSYDTVLAEPDEPEKEEMGGDEDA